MDDLRAVRAAVSVPVLAKEFVVDPRQLDLLRAAGADLVLLLAVLHPARRLARLVAAARDLGLEPLVEVHDERELDGALATGARLIGINNRDLRTLEVDPEHAVRLRDAGPRRPAGRGRVRRPRPVDHRALAGDRLRCRPGRRGADALGGPGRGGAGVRGRRPDPADLASAARLPGVKICGVTDAAGILAATRAGADAIGLNFAPGRRASSRSTRAWRSPGWPAPPPPRTAAGPRSSWSRRTSRRRVLARVVAAVDPDEVQLNGDEPPAAVAAVGRPVWKALRVGPGAVADDVIAAAHAYLDAGAGGILLDAAGGPHPGGTGIRVDTALAAAVAREVPITLAGGLSPATVGRGGARGPGGRR